MSETKTPVWFVTGCSTGFGRELAKLLLQQGYRLVATARDPSTLSDVVEGYDAQALTLALDVTDQAAIAKAVTAAEERFGQIDVLVNNAGYGYTAAVEEGEDAPVRKMFDTNVFGLVDVTKAVLPGMRKRRSGFIVNLSSIGGLRAFPGTGYYTATKHAVEALSKALSQEVAPLGIKVLLVEPGPFRTDFAGRSIGKSAISIPDYDQTSGARRKQLEATSGKQVGDPIRASQAIIDVVNSPSPPLHLPLGAMALQAARDQFADMLKQFDTWEATALGADYPENER